MSRIPLRFDAESDGDSTHQPSTQGQTAFRHAGPEYESLYRQKLGQQLMVDIGNAVVGKTYIIEKLPEGYTLWERSRPGNSKHVDRWLYGHPKHHSFDSPHRFYPHFKWLSDGKEGICTCVVCVKGKSKAPSLGKTSTLAIPRRGRPLLKGRHVDADGVPCTIPKLLALLKKEGSLARSIEENLSIEWCVEKQVNEETKERVHKQGSFVPRTGEIVLWYWAVEGETRIDPNTGQLKVWDGKAFTGHPTWLGGVVALAPIEAEPVRINDVTHETEKNTGVTNSGFRIECYPDPESDDKNFSKQYSHVPLQQIRPMALFLDTLKGIPEEEWHPTLYNVLKAMSCVSTMDRYKFKGVWPDFYISYRGMYFGAESYWAGEPIRLLPRKGLQDHVTEVIVPFQFRVRTYNVKAGSDGTISGTVADRIEVAIYGSIYTTDISFSQGRLAEFPAKSILYPYGPWYHLDKRRAKHEIPYHHTLGRLFEHEALKQLYPSLSPSAALDAGFGSVSFARNIAMNKRMSSQGEEGSGYYWADNRAEALDLATFNGEPVGSYDKNRDPQKWRQDLQTLRVSPMPSEDDDQERGNKRARVA